MEPLGSAGTTLPSTSVVRALLLLLETTSEWEVLTRLDLSMSATVRVPEVERAASVSVSAA